MKYNLLKQLYKIHSKSGFEGEIITFICKWISKNVPGAKIDFDWNTGNIYVTKGTAKTYPSIVAHLDQVQESHPTDFITIETKDIIFGYSPKERKVRRDKSGFLCMRGSWMHRKLESQNGLL